MGQFLEGGIICKGSKCRVISRDCNAVSEIIGQMLMITVVVLALSGIALTVYSEGFGIPEHIPHVDFRESVYVVNNTVQIVHAGGEAIDKTAINVILSGNYGMPDEFSRTYSMSDSEVKIQKPDGNNSTDNVLTLGDRIIINTKGSGVSLTSKNSIDLFIVHIPSQQVIQKTVLQPVPVNIPDWITPYPYGSIYDSSTPSEWLPMELLGTIDDGVFIEAPLPTDSEWYEVYEFGIDADEMGISSISEIQLKIIYSFHDNSADKLKLEVSTDGSNWTKINSNDGGEMKEYHHDKEYYYVNYQLYNLTDNQPEYIKNTGELEKLRVRFSVSEHANEHSGKTIRVDFVGVHVEELQ
ncbi:type IV pilin [Methanosarcina sp. MSH10X1]|uniref:type IV pilin n=1 Tax=Methanosarcina sp. MSH10X1 TaxID=2507075 RepID=UPI000FFC8509|nr:type IV pilin N-terminal domain-containing protein [Methanosarcina sp. MSH10X1]RXA21348.1 type IV pilin [Methanosarcina sp. MSH10X1]